VGDAERPAERSDTRDRDRARAPRFYAVGFWVRTLAGLIDLAVIVPVALLLSWIVGMIAGFGMPPDLGLDYWVLLLLDTDPSLVTVVVMLIATACLYLLFFQITMARTLGMRALRVKIIDLYGDPPSTSRAALRTGGYLLNLLTLGLGFLWTGFDSEKRGLHDWVAGTYVVKA
jgi:uncharacterized RDD family membrane protein YckC